MLWAAPAMGWEIHGSRLVAKGERVPGAYISRTTVVELLIDARTTPANADFTGVEWLFVRFEDPVDALCPRRQSRPAMLPPAHEGMPAAAPRNDFVHVGTTTEVSVRVLLAQLLTAKAAGTEVEVVIDAENCRLFLVRGL